MVSGKQRREEIKRKRIERARKLEEMLARPSHGRHLPASGIEPADRERLAQHNNTYGPLPEFYADVVFECRDCGEASIWTAKQQKWWYEIALGPIDSRAVRCLPCRRARRAADSARPEGANLVRELCTQVRALAARPSNAAAWRTIDEALTSKWWGVRTVAIRVLGVWRDETAIERLKALAAAGADARRWGGWAYEGRRAALAAYGERMVEADAPWALDVVLSSSDAWELWRPLAAQPLVFWDAAVVEEALRDDPVRLERLCRYLRTLPADPARIQRWRGRFGSHPDPRVRQAVTGAWQG